MFELTKRETLMLSFSTEQFNYDSELKMFTAEASSLGLPPRYWNSNMASPAPIDIIIILTNPKTENRRSFAFDVTDWYNGEAMGWNYTSHDGLKLLIIND
jgi:hypothetical protein